MASFNKSQSDTHASIPCFLVCAFLLMTSILLSSCLGRSATISSDTLIVPGRSIGNITLESDAVKTINALGKPDATDAAMGKAVSTWYGQHDSTKHALSIFTAQDVGNSPIALIKQIRVTNPRYRTQAGVGASSSVDEIQDIFKLQQEEGYALKGRNISVYTDTSGIAFEIDETGTCIGIVVYFKGSLHPDTYARFIPGMSNTSKDN